MSTLSRVEDNYIMMSSEESSSYLDESELELGLGLSLGGGGGKAKTKSAEAPPAAVPGGLWDHQYARILTAKDFSSVVSSKASSSSSSSSVTKADDNHYGSCGTKRTAEPSSPPGRSGVSRQVVGWPPIRTYRVNSLVNHVMKSPSTEGFTSTVDKFESKNNGVNKTNYGVNTNYGVAKKKGLLKTSFLVKVNMDGFPIGRKVDMNAHSCYESFAHTLEGMFRSSPAQTATRSNAEEQVTMPGARRTAKLLDVSSDFVLTYEDKEGDWMLVGDVPWEMFLSSVKRLRIIRTAEVNGLGMYRVFGAKFFHPYSHVFLCLHAHLFLFLVAAPSLLKKTGDS